ncbi:isopentenyl-diphosphate delta-isomerase [Natrialba hulunbeirensis JCM 10989]|uniref:Isopentenyl-diphosphate Delta-isomerase n=1 Tax=Natrialba hulunbeirensis JCM 10989 TaxID=1227493 RepID=L9ZU25_9EURY|nr:NUDIX domain-containing protein [Natrialba hulunbeirensis]ELY89052.1 isopentenyl-diphosphate delta-isomerase [Natrialba hulunbeirensis JCM 10989]
MANHEERRDAHGQHTDNVPHKNATQDVIAVDEDDTALESVNRLEAHTGDGIRHRAFTALVFDRDDNVLLAQRAPEKRLWGSYWDGTVASHPVEGQRQEEATRQRLEEELGITPDQYDDLRVTDRFEYKRYFENAGVEHEVCAVLKLSLADVDLDPNEDEVAGLLWVPYDRLVDNPEWYRQLRLCPWFEIAMRRDTQSGTQNESGLE